MFLGLERGGGSLGISEDKDGGRGGVMGEVCGGVPSLLVSLI